MAVIRATLDYTKAGFSKLEDLCLWYKPGSDLINLTKLTLLVLYKKKEGNEKKESQKESTFGSWIWETLKNIGEKIHVSGELKAKTKGSRRKMSMKLHEDKYILGYKVFKYMLGFKGFKVESIDIESTVYDLVKDLSKEE